MFLYPGRLWIDPWSVFPLTGNLFIIADYRGFCVTFIHLIHPKVTSNYGGLTKKKVLVCHRDDTRKHVREVIIIDRHKSGKGYWWQVTAESQKHGPTDGRCRSRGRQAWTPYAVLEFRVDFLIIVLISGLTATRLLCQEVTLWLEDYPWAHVLRPYGMWKLVGQV